MSRFSGQRKEAVLSRLLPPYNMTVSELAKLEGIEGNMINLDIDDIAFLQGKKYLIQNALFCPAISAHINAVPAPKSIGQSSPLAAMLSDIKHCVKHLQVRYFHVAARNRQQMFDNFELLHCNFHAEISVNGP